MLDRGRKLPAAVLFDQSANVALVKQHGDTGRILSLQVGEVETAIGAWRQWCTSLGRGGGGEERTPLAQKGVPSGSRAEWRTVRYGRRGARCVVWAAGRTVRLWRGARCFGRGRTVGTDRPRAERPVHLDPLKSPSDLDGDL